LLTGSIIAAREKGYIQASLGAVTVNGDRAQSMVLSPGCVFAKSQFFAALCKTPARDENRGLGAVTVNGDRPQEDLRGVAWFAATCTCHRECWCWHRPLRSQPDMIAKLSKLESKAAQGA